MRVPNMKKYMMKSETSAEYLDMSYESFLEDISPFLDSISLGEDKYFLRADLELLVQMFFRSPTKDNIVNLHPIT